MAEEEENREKGFSGIEPMQSASPRGSRYHWWGDEPINIDEALLDFEELRRALSQATRQSSRPNSHRGSRVIPTSRRTSRQIDDVEEDPEQAGVANVHGFDLEEYLQRSNQEAYNSGIISKKIGVSFRNLSVSGTGSGYAVVSTFLDEFLTLFGKSILERGWGYGRKAASRVRGGGGGGGDVKYIIQGFSGVVRPGEMLLVLGRPGSGTSTFLRALTNQRREFTSIEGDIHYSGVPFELAEGRYRGEILFNSEEDIHHPTLTVQQTLKFALSTKTPATRIPGLSRDAFVQQMLELFAKMFGMMHTLNTMVGNQFIRGVSGGERKRVSIIEALASRATVNAWDNSTRGLDSSTAVDYIHALRILSTLTHSTNIVTLYQAGEQIYKEFDKVCVIDNGRQIYYGPGCAATSYFESIGFHRNPRSTTADFLTSVTDPNKRRVKPGWEGKVPLTPLELETAFRNSSHWTALQEELTAYDEELRSGRDARDFRDAVKQDKSRRSGKGSPYVVSLPRQIWYLTKRDFQLRMQDKVAMGSRFFNTLVLALLIGSLFFGINRTSQGTFKVGGTLFFNIVLIGWMQMYEAIDMTVGRSITSKHTTFAFYRPSALVLAKTLVDLPILAVQCSLYTVILYFMAALEVNAGKFFLNLLFVFTCTVCLTAFNRAVGAFSKDLNVAIRTAFFGLHVMIFFTGYLQPEPNMKSWVFKWIYWAQPLTYCLEALMVNQLEGVFIKCSEADLIPGIPSASIANKVCHMAGAKPGTEFVSGTDFLQASWGYKRANVWRNFGIVIAFTIGYLAIALIGVEWLEYGVSGTSTRKYTKRPKPENNNSQANQNGLLLLPLLPISDPGNPSESKFSQTTTDTSTSSSTSTPENSSLQEKKKKKNKDREVAQGSYYTWKNATYTVNQRRLLNNITGYVKPGRLTALMGPSGAGKTTLLDTLSQRKRVGTVDGEFLLDGKNLAIDFSRSTGFVEQQDVHDGTSTVREALRFSATLRQPRTIPLAQKHSLVERIITLLELEPLADALIGEPGVGLTVEERKRVTIGVELAAKPEALLFLDEPTSGLDSTGALSIVRFLKKLADEEGLAVLCTIHQPSAILFEDFDDVLLLTTGGEEVYFGPIGDNGSTIIEYFERNGARKAAGDANPAEYILETIRRAPGTRSWAEIWEDSTEAKAVVDEIESINGSRRAILNSEHHQDRTLEYAMSLSAQTLEVTKRVWLNYWRDASYGYSKMFSNLSMALLCGVLFINSGTTIQELQSRTFGVYAIVHVSQMILTGVQPKFLEFRTLYETRERNSRIYSSTAFITAMILVEIPYAVLGSLVFFFPWWYMEGLPRSSGSAGYAFFLVVLYEIWMPHVAMWIAAMCKDMTVMSVVNPFVFVVSNGFAGIFVQYAQLPEFYRRWLFWVNPQTWLVKGLVSTALHDLRIHCARDEWVTFRPPGGQTCGEYAGGWVEHAFGRIENLAAREECRYCRYKVGDEFLETLGMKYSTHWRDLGIFSAYIFSNIFLVYVLYYLFREVRWRRVFAGVWNKNNNKQD